MHKRLTQLLAFGFLLVASLAQTQTIPTTGLGCNFTWDPYVNDPANLAAASFKLYLIKDNVQQPAKTGIPLNATVLIAGSPKPGISCKDAGVTSVGTWKANLHAVDAGGTESGPSNGLNWMIKLIGPPQNFQVN
jgi:hypothetical protein